MARQHDKGASLRKELERQSTLGTNAARNFIDVSTSENVYLGRAHPWIRFPSLRIGFPFPWTYRTPRRPIRFGCNGGWVPPRCFSVRAKLARGWVACESLFEDIGDEFSFGFSFQEMCLAISEFSPSWWVSVFRVCRLCGVEIWLRWSFGDDDFVLY